MTLGCHRLALGDFIVAAGLFVKAITSNEN
jgi:hypothetical protein